MKAKQRPASVKFRKFDDYQTTNPRRVTNATYTEQSSGKPCVPAHSLAFSFQVEHRRTIMNKRVQNQWLWSVVSQLNLESVITGP